MLLTEREIMNLDDRIMEHLGVIERFRVFSRQSSDPQVRDLVSRHQQVLQNHYQTMVGILQNAQNLQATTTQA